MSSQDWGSPCGYRPWVPKRTAPNRRDSPSEQTETTANEGGKKLDNLPFLLQYHSRSSKVTVKAETFNAIYAIFVV